jgi:hypothetical protein
MHVEAAPLARRTVARYPGSIRASQMAACRHRKTQ